MAHLWRCRPARYERRGSRQHEGTTKPRPGPSSAKWHGMSRNKDWFTYNATALHSDEPGRTRPGGSTPSHGRSRTRGHRRLTTGPAELRPFRRGVGIPDAVWTPSRARDRCRTGVVWAGFGNRRAHTGRFRDASPAALLSHRWSPQQIDSRFSPSP